MNRKLRKAVVILMALMLSCLVSCSDVHEAEYEDLSSGIVSYQETDVDDEVYVSDTEDEAWGIPDDSGYESDVYIPEGTGIVRDTGDRDQLREDVYWETSMLNPDVCLIGGSFDRNDIYAMPYSGFWIRDYSTRSENGRDPQTGDETTFTFYHFTYDDGLTLEDLDSRKAAIDRQADEIISRIPISADTWTQIRIVHDELCRLITYDKDASNLHRFDAYGALVDHEAVCNAYACAFNHIMNRLGLSAKRMYSDDHAWSVVGISSEQNYIDVTWDDTDLYDRYGNEYVNHAYLFLTLDEIELIPQHHNISTDLISESYGAEYCNYHMHEGYYMYDCSWDELVNIFREQYDAGTNMLTVRFAYQDDYDIVKQWEAADSKELNKLMGEIGYTGGYYTWFKDEVRTLSIGLYAEPQ